LCVKGGATGYFGRDAREKRLIKANADKAGKTAREERRKEQGHKDSLSLIGTRQSKINVPKKIGHERKKRKDRNKQAQR